MSYSCDIAKDMDDTIKFIKNNKNELEQMHRECVSAQSDPRNCSFINERINYHQGHIRGLTFALEQANNECILWKKYGQKKQL